MRLQPECAGGGKWIYFGFTPPRFFIAAAMNLTMMRATERYRELVADLAAECTRLRQPQMVRIRRTPAAKETRLPHDVTHVLPVTNAALFGECQHGLVDWPLAGGFARDCFVPGFSLLTRDTG